MPIYRENPIERPTLQLEPHINAHDAKQRTLGTTIHRIFYDCVTDESNVCINQLATAIDRCCPTAGGIYVMAIGEFTAINTLQSIDDSNIIKPYDLIKSESKNALQQILTLWDAESLVIFSCDINAAKTISLNIKRLQREWWRFSKGSYGEDFLSQFELCDLFVFYSATHQSLEIIGLENPIHECYECLMAW